MSEQETKHSEPRAAESHEVSDDQLDIAGGGTPDDVVVDGRLITAEDWRSN